MAKHRNRKQPVETAKAFLQKRAAQATEGALIHYLDNAPDVPPTPKDELLPAKS